MVIVYSFWDKPNKRKWYNEKYQWYSLALSVYQSNLYYGNSIMHTTIKQKEFFEKLEIPFTEISTSLEDVKYDNRIWAIGKVLTYYIQEEPFIHIDNDLILYEKIPDFDDVLVEKKESFDIPFYKDGYDYALIRCQENFKKPYIEINNSVSAGVYGVKNLVLNKEYCSEVFEICDNNKIYLESQRDLKAFMIILEQYTLACNIVNSNVVELESKHLHLTSDKYNHKYYEQIRCEVEEKMKNVYNNINKYV